jgi:hypothetical protein
MSDERGSLPKAIILAEKQLVFLEKQFSTLLHVSFTPPSNSAINSLGVNFARAWDIFDKQLECRIAKGNA